MIHALDVFGDSEKSQNFIVPILLMMLIGCAGMASPPSLISILSSNIMGVRCNLHRLKVDRSSCLSNPAQ